MALINHYQESIESFKEAEEYFENLTLLIEKGDIDTWTVEIKDAKKFQLHTPEAMDIMGTWHIVAISAVQDIPKKQQTGDGEEWIALTLTIEERQYVLLSIYLILETPQWQG